MGLTQTIQKLREQLKRADDSLGKQELLIHQREELASHQDTLKQKLHSSLRQVHSTTDSDKKRELTEMADQLQTQVSELSNRQREIDHVLDDLDEDFKALAGEIKEKLVSSIIRLNPEAEGPWNDLQKQFLTMSDTRHFMQSILHAFAEVLTPLNTAIEARLTSRRRGLMNLIFGRNPSVVVAQYLEKAKKQAKNFLDANFCNPPAPIRLNISGQRLSELEAELKKLCLACDRPMAVKHIDTEFKEIAEECRRHYELLNEHDQALDRELAALDQEMQAWVERYSQSDTAT